MTSLPPFSSNRLSQSEAPRRRKWAEDGGIKMLMIEARGLTRTFRTRQGIVEAVRGVDFTVRTGKIVGFLGPNGAGKTTTLRLLTTLLRPSSGSAIVAGCD